MKIKYRIMLEDGKYFVQQRVGILDWRIVSDYCVTEQEAFDELKEIAKEIVESKKKSKVIGKYIVDKNGIQRNMRVNGKVVSAYYPSGKPPVPEPSR